MLVGSADVLSALPLNDRAYYLAQSLTSAKSAASVGSDDVEFASSLQERIDVAQVQMEVARAIEVHGEMTDEEKSNALDRLNSELIGLDEVSLVDPFTGQS
jgi:nuclear pore complex protein Nup155